MTVTVLANVEVEMEEGCGKLAVAVPVAAGVQAETADADDNRQAQDRASQPGTSNHGSAKASHLETPCRFYRIHPLTGAEISDIRVRIFRPPTNLNRKERKEREEEILWSRYAKDPLRCLCVLGGLGGSSVRSTGRLLSLGVPHYRPHP